MINWADVVFVMSEKEDGHLTFVEDNFRVKDKLVCDLDIPDNYDRGDPELIGLLRKKIEEFMLPRGYLLEQAFQNGQLRFEGDLKLLAQPKIFAAWLRPLFRQDWVVYLKRPFGGPAYVLHYLGRYTHRVAISNHRLVFLTDGQVTFRWRDSAHHNEQKLLSLSLDEFLCRFLLHILPKGFVRIRNCGFLANRKRATLLPLCLQLLGSAQPPQAEQHASSTADCPDLWRCPKCGGPMKVIERLTAAEIKLRSPPRISVAA